MKIHSTYYLAVLMAILSTSFLQAQEDDAEVYDLSPFSIDATQDRGYGTSNSLGASRIALPNSDIAASIITLNEQLFQDVAAIDATEVLGYASGIQLASDRHPGHTQYSLRGYAQSGVNLRDGLPDRFVAADISLDESTAYQRIEVIKGPAGTLYGSHSMGGIVNKVSKFALSSNFTNVDFQVAGGNDEFLKAVIDTNSKIGENSAVRAVVSVKRGDRHYHEQDAPDNWTNITLMGSHNFNNDGGKIWGRIQYLDYELDREQGWQYLTGYLTPGGSAPTVKDPIFAVGRHTNIVPEDDVSKGDIYAHEAGYEKSFAGNNSIWTLRLVARHNKGDGDKTPSYSQGRPIPVHANGQIVTYINADGEETNGDNRYVSAQNGLVADWRAGLTLRDFRGFRENSGLYADLHGSFEGFGATHDLILNAQGGNSRQERAFFFWSVQNPNDPTDVGNSFSAVGPNFTGFNSKTIPQNNEKKFNRFQGYSKGTNSAIGFQDNMKFMEDKLILVIGARYDEVSNDQVRFDVAKSITQDEFVRDESSWTSNSDGSETYKLGVVAKVADGVSLFAQTATTFNPISKVSSETGEKFPNQEGEIIEIGAKFSTPDNRLTATLSWFDMELTNVIINVPLPQEFGGGTIPRAIGTQKTDGIELDLAWQPTDNVSLLFAASDLDSTDANGRFFRGVPIKSNWSAFGKYEFTDGVLDGAFAGAGFRHNAPAPGDSGNSFFTSGGDVADLFFGYSQNNWSVQLNVYNVLEEDGIISAVIDRLAARYPDTNYRMTARFRF